jgi:hypothetical protein
MRFPKKHLRSLGRFSRNTRPAGGQCGRAPPPGAEISAAAASIAGGTGPAGAEKSLILLGFRNGMTFADDIGVEVTGRA